MFRPPLTPHPGPLPEGEREKSKGREEDWSTRTHWEGERTLLLTRESSGECLLGFFDDGSACFDDVIGFFQHDVQ